MKRHLGWLLPILIMAALTPFLSTWDQELARYYYNTTRFASTPFYDFMYHYGILPAQILVALAVAVLAISYGIPKWKKWRIPAWYLILTMAIGAGVIVHLMLKDHWGRPRPKQVIEFGGNQPFRSYYQPNFFHQPEPSKSFTCGHCTMGFYFFAVGLLCWRLGYRYLSYLSYLIAFLLGIALSVTRIAQGGHFLSDVLMTALIMWLTAYVCDVIFLRSNPLRVRRDQAHNLPKS